MERPLDDLHPIAREVFAFQDERLRLYGRGVSSFEEVITAALGLHNPVVVEHLLQICREAVTSFLARDSTATLVPAGASVPPADRVAIIALEWLLLKEHDTASWTRAVQIDEALRNRPAAITTRMRSPIYLHRSATPLATAVLRNEGQYEFPSFAVECEGACGV